MKTIFRSFGMGMLLTGAMAVGAFAQEAPGCSAAGSADAQVEMQTKINGIYKTDMEQALNMGKEYLEKWGTCEFSAAYVAWLKGDGTTPGRIEVWEKAIQERKGAAARSAIIAKFDDGIKQKNWDAVYAAGNEFLAKYPNDPIRTNIVTQLGLIGLYEAYPPKNNFKYSDESLKYAKMALSEIKAGAKPGKDPKTGVEFFGGPLFAAPPVDAVSELNYAIAYINFWAKKDQKAALPYYYEAVRSAGIHKDDPLIYDSLATYYVTGSEPVGAELAKMIQTMKTLTTDEEKLKLDAEIKAKIALYNGYLERAMDSLARAHKAFGTKTDAYAKQRREAIYKQLQDMYKLRFDKDTGMDAYLATTVAKPLPNPSSDVQPVVDEQPTTDTNTTTAAPAAPAKPVATTPTKPLSTNTIKSTATAAKKKGTR